MTGFPRGSKHAHQFFCHDSLWQAYERMAVDMEKNIDELIGDALLAFAQLAGYDETSPDSGLSTPPPMAGTLPPPRTGPPPAMPRSTTQSRPGYSAVPARLSRPTPPGVPISQSGVTPPPMEMSAQGAPMLYLVFDSQKYKIDKDQFIIGRGIKSSDLPIKDGNISRKHAAVIRRNGTYFIKDLGSTNGIDYKGMRIDNKRIDEGDVFHLCDYELRFTYKR